MPSLDEGKLTFRFAKGWSAIKYDETAFYRKQFQRVCDSKAVDIVAIGDCTWLIEVKDFRHHPSTKPSELPAEIARKVRDSLAGLAAASANAIDATEKQFAIAALRTQSFRVALHLEQPRKHSKLFPRVFDPADILQKLKQSLKAIDPHPVVQDMSIGLGTGWSVSPKGKP